MKNKGKIDIITFKAILTRDVKQGGTRKMLIDIHTHAFPDKIAERTVEKLKGEIIKIQQGKYIPKNCHNGTLAGLERAMDESGVSKSFVMPIATTVTQSGTINDFAEGIRNEKMISFGSVHPMQEDALSVIENLKERGFKGIKLHPEFQQFYIDSERSVEILKKCEELEMYVLIHAGADIGLPPPVHCTPKMLKNALSHFEGKYLIAAHMGGFMMWEEVYELLCGTPILMDTAFISEFIPKKLCLDIIRKHGAEKILFGSDSPWEKPSDTLEFIESIGLTEDELEKIKYKNAERLF